MASTVRSMILETIKASRRCVFAGDIAQVVGMKKAAVHATCSDLINDGLLKAKRKYGDDGNFQRVFYVRDDQIRGVPNLHDYVKEKRGKRKKYKTQKESAPADALIVLPVSGDNDVSSITLTMDSARALYETLRRLFWRAK